MKYDITVVISFDVIQTNNASQIGLSIVSYTLPADCTQLTNHPHCEYGIQNILPNKHQSHYYDHCTLFPLCIAKLTEVILIRFKDTNTMVTALFSANCGSGTQW